MTYVLKKENPGLYHVKVNNFHRYTVVKTSGEKWAQSWDIIDIIKDQRFTEFVSLKECKEFIKEEIFS